MLIGGALAINGGMLLISRLFGSDGAESRDMANSARAVMGGAMAGARVAKGAKGLMFGKSGAKGKDGKRKMGGLFGAGVGIGKGATAVISGSQGYTKAGGALKKGASGLKNALKNSSIGRYGLGGLANLKKDTTGRGMMDRNARRAEIKQDVRANHTANKPKSEKQQEREMLADVRDNRTRWNYEDKLNKKESKKGNKRK